MAASGTRARERYSHTRWNFGIIVLDASFFMGALAFVDPVAVLPVLLTQLTGSELVVGLMGALQRAGWMVPQLLATSWVLHRPLKKPFIVAPVVVSRLPFLGVAILFGTGWGAARPALLLGTLIGVWGFFFFLDGLVGVPWHDIVARTIPPRLRGRFFGSMQFLGGLLAIGAGAVVRRVLADPELPFPYNYGRLFALLFVFLAISTVFVLLIREPREGPTSEAQSLAAIVRAIPDTLRRYRDLRRLITAQIMCGVGGLATPFYAVYANVRLGLEPAVAGLFIWAAIAGSVAASGVWALLSDRCGSTRVIRGVSGVIVLTPLVALCVPPLMRILGAEEAMGYGYAAVFLLNGAVWGGMWIGFTNHVLEIAPDHIRPLFLGLQATLSAPTVVMPLLGGWLLSVISYEALFGTVAALSVGAFAYSFRLREPRHGAGAAP